jgi:hypothetical protein
LPWSAPYSDKCTPHRLAVLLFALAVILGAQTVIGRLSAEGQNLLWLHVPLGVALVGLTVQPARIAGRLAGRGGG